MKTPLAALTAAALLLAAGSAGAQWSSDPLVNNPICTASAAGTSRVVAQISSARW